MLLLFTLPRVPGGPRLLHLELKKETHFVSESDIPSRSSTSGGPQSGGRSRGKGKVAAVIGLSLLEVIRARDLPTEILAAEDPTQTMPRRLGLSEVVDLQIRRFSEQVKKRGRITDDEARDLFHLVLRRPDCEEVFFQAGELLAEKDGPLKGVKRLYPERARYSLARRQIRKRLRALFGRSVGGLAHGSFTLEARGHFFLDMDPGGDACHLLTGFVQTVLGRYLRRDVTVSHTTCQGHKDDLCRWTVSDNSQ